MARSSSEFQSFESQLEKAIEDQKSRKLQTVRNLVFTAVFAVLLVAVVMYSSSTSTSTTEFDTKKSNNNRIKKTSKVDPSPTITASANTPSKASKSNNQNKISKDNSKGQHNVPQQQQRSSIKKYKGTTESVDFTMKRVGYEALQYFSSSYDSHLTYAFLSNYSAVIEPSVPMEFHLYDSSSLNEGYSYEYVICPNNESNDDGCQRGEYYYDSSSDTVVSTSVTFVACSPHTDTYTISIFTISNDEVINQSSAQAVCMYVRREIRSLSSSDLESYLDASFQLYNLSSEEGIDLYGENFMTNHKLVKLHYFNAGQRDSDHLHEGNGFYAQHVKMTNMFEVSVQTVDPSVTVPYWDFTIDHASGNKAFDAFVASSDVFGSISYPAGSSKAFTKADNSVIDARIPDGRWAGLLAESESDKSLVSAYGYLRAPWCLNPSPYVSRFAFDWDVTIGYLPSCKTHYEILEYSDMMNYFYQISLDPHGTAHTAIGGIYGCDSMDYLSEMGVFSSTSAQNEACAEMANVIKEAYRSGYIDVPTNCEVDITDPSNTNCAYSCVSKVKGYKAATFMYSRVSSYVNTTAYGEKAMLKIFKNFICDGGVSLIYAGDHYESSAMSDPSFWVMHPTIERVTHAKFMSGGFDNETWAVSTENDFVCTKQVCYDEGLDRTSNFSTCCYGHYEDDRMFNGILSTRDAYFGPTNGEIISSTDPRSTNYSVSYIYDKFSWEHCGPDFSITNLLDTMKSDYDAVKSGAKPGPALTPSQKEVEIREKLETVVAAAKEAMLTADEEAKELELIADDDDKIIAYLLDESDDETKAVKKSKSKTQTGVKSKKAATKTAATTTNKKHG